MKYVIAALAVAGLALGIAPTAGATTIPAFCTNHQEYLAQPAAALHVSGNLYKAACALGPGNGGNAISTATGPPAPNS
jgi:hypothetical protein